MRKYYIVRHQRRSLNISLHGISVELKSLKNVLHIKSNFRSQKVIYQKVIRDVEK